MVEMRLKGEKGESFRGVGSCSVDQDWDTENKGGHGAQSALGVHTVQGKGWLLFSFSPLPKGLN